MPPLLREVRLSNGLKVILKESHTSPVISTWVWYRVGSRNEVEGHTGISHWVEHMMFKGSSLFPKGSIMRAVDRFGGYVNAMTSYDFTAYYTTLPADRAELALQIEADRMTTATFDADEVESERTVIIAEREGSENEPHYVLTEEMVAASFRVHPYHHETVGWKSDLEAITRDQLYAHYRRHYVPANAVLIVVGDFESDAYLPLVKRYFASLPTGDPPPVSARPEPPQRGERRVTVRMPGSTPLVRVAYHTPPVSHPDYIPLVVLDAVLSGGKAMFVFGESPTRSARLYRALVETQLASSAGSNYHPSLDPFLLSLGATVREGREPQVVEAALLAEIKKLQDEPVQPQELAVAIRQTQAQFAYASESVSSQALTLGFLEMVDNYRRMDGLLGEFARVTPEDILRVARTYLTEDNRTAGWFLPTGEGAAGSEEDEEPVAAWTRPSPGTLSFLAKPASPAIGPENITRAELDNGIVVLVKENPTSPSVSVEGDILAGGVHESDDKAGLAGFVASMLRRGTQKRTFQEINVALDNVGASMGFSGGLDEVEFGGRALAEDFDLLVNFLAEIMTQPSFSPVELEKLRGQILTNLGILDMDTDYRSDCAFMAALYPKGHPYARPIMGTRETFRALTREDLMQFYHTYYHPGSVVMSVVGAVEPRRIIDKLAATFGQWRVSEPLHSAAVPLVETPPEIVTPRVNLPGKSQADLVWGVVGMSRSSPDYYAAMIANLVLGRLGLAGRLGDKIRDEQGLAYYVGSSVHGGPGPHPWQITAGVNPKDVEAAVASILAEVARLRDEPISDAELEDSRSYLTGVLPLHLETNEGIANFLLNVEEYNLGLDYLERYSGIIRSVVKDDIQRVARQYLTLDRYVLAMAGTFE